MGNVVKAMLNMAFYIEIGDRVLGLLEKVEIHRSVELLSDTAKIVLPYANCGDVVPIETYLKRGMPVSIRLGYEEMLKEGQTVKDLPEEFRGWLQRIDTDKETITLECEDDLYLFRKPLENEVLKKVKVTDLLQKVVKGIGQDFKVVNTYDWTYEKFVINTATGYDVLKKVQEECGADIYLKDGELHVHAPGEKIQDKEENTVYYDLSKNVEDADLTYRLAEDKKVEVVVKANMPDGTVKEIKVGATGGEKVEIICATHDEASMKLRGELERKRRSFDGYEGNITTWLLPMCQPGNGAAIHDAEYKQKDGTYFVTSVTTEFSSAGGKRKVDLGFRLS